MVADQLYTWGLNDAGQLGRESAHEFTLPTLVNLHEVSRGVNALP